MMLYRLKQLLRLMGLESRALYNADGSRSGAEIHWRRPPEHIMRGAISAVIYGQTTTLFFVGDDADTVQRHHVQGRFYEIEELEVIRKYFPGGNFLDVGANVGNHALFALNILNADRVFCFEPNPLALSILRLNLKLNEVTGKVLVFEEGLSDQPGEAGLIWDRNNLGSARFDGRSGGARFPISIGDERLAGEHIDFIKIDTEGHEIKVLKGLASTIMRDRPTLFVEVMDTNIEAFNVLGVELEYRVVETMSRYQGNANFVAVPIEKQS